eukprot:CAMPEP_0183574718 /NCGR_PEP_ID=MMETSP0371-20130417/133984_1 /TAXON_ID=268820 /ORGANISM="Peridinium aciculiferum, Strain PAER-2" /LENGTH=116 /DNA_ID=CAMNT_0025784807 /DNA_START=8 /DNA_END=356 /DNA_ORIENTATION=+
MSNSRPAKAKLCFVAENRKSKRRSSIATLAPTCGALGIAPLLLQQAHLRSRNLSKAHLAVVVCAEVAAFEHPSPSDTQASPAAKLMQIRLGPASAVAAKLRRRGRFNCVGFAATWR